MKYTPGPWKLLQADQRSRHRDYTVFAIEGKPALADVFCDSEEDEANARLIAAAPEMYHGYELLLELSDKNDYETYKNAVRGLAFIMIAKAEGKDTT